MSLVEEDISFGKDDVDIMKRMLSKFHDYHQGSGLPDWSSNYVAYLPVFSIALLISQQKAERTNKILIRLTWALVFLTIVIAFMTLWTVFR
ncbi:MAG: hypothetical protein WD751_04060 [Anaerolineales bacterium]